MFLLLIPTHDYDINSLFMERPSPKKIPLFLKIILWAAGVSAFLVLAAFTVYLSQRNKPLSEKMDLPTVIVNEEGTLLEGAEEPGEDSLPIPVVAEGIKVTPSSPPVCGKDNEWIVLAVGIDYRGQDYLYGLADVIRVVRIDFTKPQVNIVPIPRNVLVSPPPRLDVAGDMLLNQAYLFGTEGMGHYSGSGYGAGSLAETIYYTFGVRSDQYVVVDFRAFVKFIDLIGGIEVDLPTYVDNNPVSYFPAGKQTLNGTQALELARIRRKYSDVARINNQSIVLQGIFNRMKNPAVIAKIPQIYDTMIDSVLTDLTPEKISTLICLLEKIDSSSLNFYETPVELLAQDAVFIPNMNQEMIIYHWGQEYIDWLHRSIWESK